jgi:hypothetical protein
LPRCRQRDTARLALEQACAECIFKFLDVLADPRLRHQQCIGGGAEAARLRHLNKNAKLVQVEHAVQTISAAYSHHKQVGTLPDYSAQYP